MGYYPPRVSLALRTPGWGFHTVRGGIDPGDHRICPRFVGVVYLYKDRAAPPIDGPALHDSGVKTVQWREREGHDSYQEVEDIRLEIVALLWSGLGHIRILAMGCGAVEIGGI